MHTSVKQENLCTARLNTPKWLTNVTKTISTSQKHMCFTEANHRSTISVISQNIVPCFELIFCHL